LFQFVSLLLTHRQVELRFVLVLFGFCHLQCLHLVPQQPITQAEKYTLKSVGVKSVLDMRRISV
jgi:hypothetical protein